jgi:hypothetical protein
VIHQRYGNLFHMYRRITGEDPYRQPMRIYPAAHYTMDGLWVDYDLMSNLAGLYVIGEASFSDHGANRLGAMSPSMPARPPTPIPTPSRSKTPSSPSRPPRASVAGSVSPGGDPVGAVS